MTLESGFEVRVVRPHALPYPVNIILPGNHPDGTAAPRCKGPQLDIVVPADDFRHAALGRFMASWSLLESQLHFVVSKLLNVDQASTEVVMSTLGVKQIIDLLVGLGQVKLVQDDAKALVNLTERFSKLNSKRNKLVHGHWVLEANIIVKSGEAMLLTHFLREQTLLDPKEAEALGNLKNQRHRARFCFTPKRIISVIQDVEKFKADITQFIENARFLSLASLS